MQNIRVKIFIFLADIFLVILSFFVAFCLRFDWNVPKYEYVLLFKALPFIVIIRMGCFVFFGVYHEMKKYLGIKAVINIFKAVSVSSIIFVVFIVVLQNLTGFPRSIYFIDAILVSILVSGLRFSERILKIGFNINAGKIDNRILIIGAGDVGNIILKELRNKQKSFSKIVGFVDDDIMKSGMKIDGIAVLGNHKNIEKIVSKHHVTEIIIAISNIDTRKLKNILNECEKTKAVIKIIPSVSRINENDFYLKQVKNINIEDLLGREMFNIHPDIIDNYLAGKTVLVTGAGGSIGSEICRQILKFNISKLILFGRGEHSIYEIHQELQNSSVKIERVLGDIINKKKLEKIFQKFKPDVVFHAAADKHVELMELNPDEAVLNNVIGTKNLIDTCDEFKVEKLICISTDKAANPQNVMGYSKRVVELYIQRKDTKYTKVMAVRFGNVLGSRGSVIPLFKKQIEQRQDITITDPSVNRYFMTISEAAQLVVEVGAIGNNGEIFLLDMGKPIKIFDLAKDMIKLAGLKLDVDMKIKFIGLKPGEKMTEDLTNEYEKLCKTINSKIYKLENLKEIYSLTDADVEDLRQLAIEMDIERLIEKLHKIVGV
jgi:FlaA1/EpsC-like NDP-sugar epimerase